MISQAEEKHSGSIGQGCTLSVTTIELMGNLFQGFHTVFLGGSGDGGNILCADYGKDGWVTSIA